VPTDYLLLSRPPNVFRFFASRFVPHGPIFIFYKGHKKNNMPLYDALTLFFWTGLSTIRFIFAIPLLYFHRRSTKLRIRIINALAAVLNLQDQGEDAYRLLGEDIYRLRQKEADEPLPAADDHDPRMWGDYDERMDKLARKWIFPLAVLNSFIFIHLSFKCQYCFRLSH
jgi:hypothetical protein